MEMFRPGYRYGYESAQRFRGRQWGDVEKDLERDWGTYAHRGTGTWQQIKERGSRRMGPRNGSRLIGTAPGRRRVCRPGMHSEHRDAGAPERSASRPSPLNQAFAAEKRRWQRFLRSLNVVSRAMIGVGIAPKPLVRRCRMADGRAGNLIHSRRWRNPGANAARDNAAQSS